MALLATAPPAGADVYEGFDYPTGPVLTPLIGGSGFAAGSSWSDGSIVAGSLADPTGTLATSGNHIRALGPFTARRLQQVLGTPATDVWIGWLQRRETPPPESAWHGLTIAEPTVMGWRGKYLIGEPGGGPGDGSYVIGMAGDDDNVVSSDVPVVAGRTVFLVAHLQFRDGNDLATLYVNPTPGTVPPAAGVSYSGLDMPIVNPMLNPGGHGFDVVYAFDEFRIGPTYGSVAPLVPEPSGAALAAAAFVALLRRRRP